jgi:hypothetical protein
MARNNIIGVFYLLPNVCYRVTHKYYFDISYLKVSKYARIIILHLFLFAK